MRKVSRTLLGACALCFMAIVSVQTSNQGASVDNVRMQEVVKSMLGFKDMPKRHQTNENAPQYMLDLYERFKNGQISNGKIKGNTVRSIQAKSVTLGGESMFVFNLSSLISTEQMISAEIHLFRHRKTRYNKKAEFELVMHEIFPHTTVESGKIIINPKTYGWQWFDVTNTVKHCITERSVIPHSLGLNFKIVKSKDNFKLLKLSKFMHHHSVPYLIIYSNDSQDLDLEEIENMKNKEVLNSLSNSKVDTVIPVRTKRRRRSLTDNSSDLPIFTSRSRTLSILTNEIPETPDHQRPIPLGTSLHTHPGMLQTRRESRHRLSDSKLIPYPGEYVDTRKRNKWRNRRKKNRKGRRKNTLELPKEWEDLQQMAEEENIDNVCGRRKLVVDFNDIGWGEWIISPKSFKAHYCAGSCPFPLTKKLRPTNHATIQSLVNAVGINADVPAPCCVPDKLSSITLLYFDENRNVVLKNYPNMTVQKCACR